MLPARPEVGRAIGEAAREHGAEFTLDAVKTGLRIGPGSYQQWARDTCGSSAHSDEAMKLAAGVA